jgi:hypothetical protein
VLETYDGDGKETESCDVVDLFFIEDLIPNCTADNSWTVCSECEGILPKRVIYIQQLNQQTHFIS